MVYERYLQLASEIGEEIPCKYDSSITSFQNDLEAHVDVLFDFYRPMNRDKHERGTLLIPRKYAHSLTADRSYSDEECTMVSYTPPDTSDFNILLQAAAILRANLENVKGHSGVDVQEEDAMAIVPPNLHMFLNVLLGGKDILEEDNNIETVTLLKDQKILSVAQDLIFIFSGGRKLTPKHIGLGITLHQETRSKALVQLFNRAGHTISYDQVLQFDTALAEKSLESMDPKTGQYQ